MNHYCTYCDRGLLAQGLALWRSLAKCDVDSVLWVLALDEFTADVLREVGGTWLRVVPLAEVEAGDADLAAAKANRTRAEYFFTLSPCWPRWLLAKQGMRVGIERITSVEAEMFFFASPARIFEAMDAAKASVLVTAQRLPLWLKRYERRGKFNVGLLSFQNDGVGRACLDEWRGRCLEWCHDRLEEGKYTHQKYLDEWPERVGAALLVLPNAGVNLAPWNGAGVELAAEVGGAGAAQDELRVDGEPLVLFHFAQFRPIYGDWWWESGQLDYGVMPRRLRRRIYSPYGRALLAARDELAARRAGFDFTRRPVRSAREFGRSWLLRLVFGGGWLRVGGEFFNLRGGLGRWSGQCREKLRAIFLRR